MNEHFNELSQAAKNYVLKSFEQTFLSPLEAIRCWQEGNISESKLRALYEAERYLINEA